MSTRPSETASLTREIIVYRIRPEQLDQFATIKDQMITESLTLDGLRSCTTARVQGEDGVFADTMIWTSRQAAEDALPVFETLPTAPRFLGMMAGPPIHHLYLDFEPDRLDAQPVAEA